MDRYATGTQAFDLAIAPAAWARPRALSIGGGVRMFTSPKARSAREALQWLLRERGARMYAPMRPLVLTLDFVRLYPTSAPKGAIKRSGLHPATRPDLDQYVKLVMDAGNGLLWDDDARVVQLHAMKSYGERELVHITVSPI